MHLSLAKPYILQVKVKVGHCGLTHDWGVLVIYKTKKNAGKVFRRCRCSAINFKSYLVFVFSVKLSQTLIILQEHVFFSTGHCWLITRSWLYSHFTQWVQAGV